MCHIYFPVLLAASLSRIMSVYREIVGYKASCVFHRSGKVGNDFQPVMVHEVDMFWRLSASMA